MFLLKGVALLLGLFVIGRGPCPDAGCGENGPEVSGLRIDVGAGAGRGTAIGCSIIVCTENGPDVDGLRADLHAR